jgi:hypothetical protein
MPIMVMIAGLAVAIVAGSQFLKETQAVNAPRRRRPWDEQ